MKKIIILLALIVLYIPTSFSQCTINSFIEDNYTFDAKVLALREIISDPSDPDYDNPFVPEERIIPYLEKLSAIYDQAVNEPLIHQLFNEYQIHTNVYAYNTIFTPYKSIDLFIENETDWLADFIATGISGIDILDQLITDYQFTITNSIIFNDQTYVALESALEFVNITALKDDFETVDGLLYAEPSPGPFGTGVYNGIPYEFELGIFAIFCDIVLEGEQFTFSVHGGDCPAGCIYNDYWSINVTEDCEVILNINPFEVTEFVFSPNPVSELLKINLNHSENYAIKIYSIQGKLINKYQNSPKSINVSGLYSGIYFIELKTINGNRQIQKFVKK